MKTCRACGIQFKISKREREFLDKLSPVFRGVKYVVPEPTFCPSCRQKRRLCFRNERSLYKNNCALTGKPFISTYKPNTDYKVYSSEAFFGDKWNAFDYGREFGFTKTFTEQFDDLLHDVPHLSSLIINAENCDYTTFCVDSKNCYMSQRLGDAERVHYSYLAIEDCLDCIDCLQIVSCELCYEALDCEKCYECVFVQNCQNCSGLKYCFDCIGCNNCFGSINLRNQRYCFYNEQLSKEDYSQKVEEFERNYSQEERYRKFEEFKLTQIHKENSNINNENVVGNRVHNSKNIYYGFDTDYVEDGIYINGCEKGRDQMDGDFLFYGERMYDQISCSHSHDSIFSFGSYDSNNVLYSFSVYSCSNVFGCANLRNGKYCILNKQYTKDEYEELVPKIIEHMKSTGEWGEFLSEKLSPFEYEETVAAEYFPLENIPKIQSSKSETQNKSKAQNLNNLSESICNEVLICEVSGKAYKIIPQELEFYRKMNLPIPRKCPDVRYADRLTRRNPRLLFDRKCNKCQKDIKTTYDPSRLEIVYCEECYLKEVY